MIPDTLPLEDTESTTPLTDSLIELIYAGNDLSQSNYAYALAIGDLRALKVASGATSRFQDAVEAVRKAAL